MKISSLVYQNDQWSDSFPEVNSEHVLLIAFGGSNYLHNDKPFQQLAEHYPQAKIVGCSSSGEIYGTHLKDDSIVLAIVELEKTPLNVVSSTINNPDETYATGVALAKKLPQKDLRAVLVLSDGLKVNGSQLVEGMTANLATDVIITGGLAGDGDRFENTWVLVDGKPSSGHVTAVGFYGDAITVSYGSQGGWDQFGPERTVTRSKDNVVYEIDHKPALEIYKRYLGERSNELPASALLFPLSIKPSHDSDYQVVRTILAVDEKENSMTFAGNVPQGWRAQFMRANFDRLVDGAMDAGAMLDVSHNLENDKLLIAISCVGRRLVLGERTEEEVEATFEKAPANTQQIGFYSYGEISPSGYAPCSLHNQTMTLTLITEK